MCSYKSTFPGYSGALHYIELVSLFHIVTMIYLVIKVKIFFLISIFNEMTKIF